MSNIIPANSELALSELLDRALNKGVVATGDLTISIANVDLIYLGLKLMLSSVETAESWKSARSNLNSSCGPARTQP